MCLYPRLMPNPKYRANKKNGGVVPIARDPRVLKVPIGCGKCIECMNQKAKTWKARLHEDIKENKNAVMVTLTFSQEWMDTIEGMIEETQQGTTLTGYNLDNAIAKKAVRLFLERWRKKYGTSVRHWLVTELGHNGTERIHLHGLIWTDNKKAIKERWMHGFVYIGKYVNDQTINYIAKYVTKVDFDHKEYTPIICTSAGIGKAYTKTESAKKNRYIPGRTEEEYKTRQGKKINMPIYWRNDIYTEEQREALWLEKLDKQERYILGKKIDISTEKGLKAYENMLKEAQAKNERLGYGNDTKNWERIRYENETREINRNKNRKNINKKRNEDEFEKKMNEYIDSKKIK